MVLSEKHFHLNKPCCRFFCGE